MEKNSNKLIIFIFLGMVVLTFSVGFAAYSRTLYISESTTEISPENTFTPNVKFKANTLTCTNKSGEGAVSSSGQLAEEDTSWSNISVSLKKPGDAVTCSVVVSNDSSYDAFLKEITFDSVLNCTTNSRTTPKSSNQEALCGTNGVTAKVSDGVNSATVTGVSSNNNTSISTNNIISSGSEGTITFDIEYSSTGNLVDEDMLVTLPKVTLLYKSSNE